jgi:hypothetical protein
MRKWKRRASKVGTWLGDGVGELIAHAAMYAFIGVGLWFLSQWWSAWVFLIAGIALMFGLPVFFHFRSNDTTGLPLLSRSRRIIPTTRSRPEDIKS